MDPLMLRWVVGLGLALLLGVIVLLAILLPGAGVRTGIYDTVKVDPGAFGMCLGAVLSWRFSS